MTLIEAIKSGRPFKRRCHHDWFHTKSDVKCSLGWVYWFDGNRERTWEPSADDMIADDYETREPTVPITRAQFWEAVEGAINEWEGQHAKVATNFADAIAKRLGLGEP